MEWKKELKKIDVLWLFKTSIGSTLAILLANRLGLSNASTAGIITLLTIQNTRRETLDIALRRTLAFFVAVIVAFIVFSYFGYNTTAFGGFIFIFVAICSLFGLKDGIVMNAVLTTHFLNAKSMNSALILNEIGLLFIGMIIGIIVNLIMPKYGEEIRRQQKIVEFQIKNVLSYIAKILKGEGGHFVDEKDRSSSYFYKIDMLLENLLDKSYEEADNRLLTDTKSQISYLEMRKRQVVVLKDMMRNAEDLNHVLPQSLIIANYLERVVEFFHEYNNVENLLKEQQELFYSFKSEQLPSSREEFENRAILFQILRDLEYFLSLKKSFMRNEKR